MVRLADENETTEGKVNVALVRVLMEFREISNVTNNSAKGFNDQLDP